MEIREFYIKWNILQEKPKPNEFSLVNLHTLDDLDDTLTILTSELPIKPIIFK